MQSRQGEKGTSTPLRPVFTNSVVQSVDKLRLQAHYKVYHIYAWKTRVNPLPPPPPPPPPRPRVFKIESSADTHAVMDNAVLLVLLSIAHSALSRKCVFALVRDVTATTKYYLCHSSSLKEHHTHTLKSQLVVDLPCHKCGNRL